VTSKITTLRIRPAFRVHCIIETNEGLLNRLSGMPIERRDHIASVAARRSALDRADQRHAVTLLR
jgi:hypothetical protein